MHVHMWVFIFGMFFVKISLSFLKKLLKHAAIFPVPLSLLLTPSLSLPLITIVIGFTFDNPFQARNKQAGCPSAALILRHSTFIKVFYVRRKQTRTNWSLLPQMLDKCCCFPAQLFSHTHTQTPHRHTLSPHTHTHSQRFVAHAFILLWKRVRIRIRNFIWIDICCHCMRRATSCRGGG